MGMDAKTKEFVALGAAIGGNCVPCLQYHFKKCAELGATGQELQEAIDMAKTVKEMPNKKIYEAADELLRGRNP